MLDNLKGKKIILASKSPRRQELLRGLGIEFEVRTREIPEDYPASIAAEDVPLFLAEKKALEFLDDLAENEILITADTIVIHQQNILEKPLDKNHAHSMLRKLADSEHTVVTGVCCMSKTKKIIFADKTNVYFGPLTEDEIDYYIEHFKPFDKAGSYGAQDWIGLTTIYRLEGSYFNVMGLPVHRLYDALKKF